MDVGLTPENLGHFVPLDPNASSGMDARIIFKIDRQKRAHSAELILDDGARTNVDVAAAVALVAALVHVISKRRPVDRDA